MELSRRAQVVVKPACKDVRLAVDVAADVSFFMAIVKGRFAKKHASTTAKLDWSYVQDHVLECLGSNLPRNLDGDLEKFEDAVKWKEFLIKFFQHTVFGTLANAEETKFPQEVRTQLQATVPMALRPARLGGAMQWSLEGSLDNQQSTEPWAFSEKLGKMMENTSGSVQSAARAAMSWLFTNKKNQWCER